MGLNVVIAASEILPFAKTGGLADVIGALPGALTGQGVETTLFMPLYREVKDGDFDIKPTGMTVNVPVGKRLVTVELYKGRLGDAVVYFLSCDEYFDRSFLYGTPEGAYFDNLERFTLFSRGVIEAVMMLGINPDVMHCNDWQTGLIPAYMKTLYSSVFSKTATVFTLHNMAYQGVFPTASYGVTGLPYSAYTPEGIEYWGSINLLKAGIVYSDIITTVSETYSREIQTEEQGCGLEGVLAGRSDDLFGILNGVDYDIWDPETDKDIAANYSSKDLKGKAACKKALIKEYGLKIKQSKAGSSQSEPLIGMISRLTDQKGFDIMAEAAEAIIKMGVGIVILGSGERKYQELMTGLAKTYKGRLGVKIGFDNALSHRIEAGADFFLMPSRFEPCGLNQFYSLKYGTIPIVRATGGLEDSVADYKGGKGNGFKFRRYTATDLSAKVAEAVELYKDKAAFKALRIKAMNEDFSWSRSAMRYFELYELAISRLKK